MKNRLEKKFKIGLILVILGVFASAAPAAEIPRMSKEKLRPMMDSAEVVIVDVRSGRDWKASEYKIKGAVRLQWGDLESWAAAHAKDKTLVFYCA